jgi:minor extracellular protease Epr
MPSDSKFHSEVTDARTKDIAPYKHSGVCESDDYASEEPKSRAPSQPRELIEVVFTKAARSGVETWDFDREAERKEFSKNWSEDLREMLQRNKLVSWKPSFPLQYPWSSDCSKESARVAYLKAERDKFVTFKFPVGTDVIPIAKELRELPEIAQAVSVPHLAPPHTLSDHFTGTGDPAEACAECLTNQWYLSRCDVPGAWAQQASGKGVIIADIDWGFDLGHPDLFRTELSKNIITNSPNVSDGNLLNHGNGVLGLAGAGVSEGGMAGIAYESTLWAIQAGTGAINRPVVEPAFWVEAINFVLSTQAPGRKVIILEVQTHDFSNIEMVPSIRQAIMEAIAAQIVVCVPAGNGNRSRDAGLDDEGLPIPDTGSIVVGATKFDPETNPRCGTNGGRRVVVYAPGDSENDLTCGSAPTRYRFRFGGTSSATAKVAGVVALMLEKNDQLTTHEIREILMQSKKRVMDQGTTVGVLLDANQAVSEAINMRSTIDVDLSVPLMNHGELALHSLRSMGKAVSVLVKVAVASVSFRIFNWS